MNPLKTSHRLLTVSGTDFERGRQQGLAFRGCIPEMIGDIRKIEILPLGLQKYIPVWLFEAVFRRAGRDFLKRHQPFFDSFTGADLRAKIDGLAEGFGVSSELVYGLAAMEVITSEMPHVPSYACTSLVFEAAQTRAGRPLLAYNHDFPESFGPHLYVRKNLPKKGQASLSLAYPVLLGAIAGVNEAGLAVSINHAFERRVKKNQAAMMVTWLLQDCLDQCKSTEEAVAHVLKTPVTNGSMLTFVDKSGARAVVELSSHRRIRRTDDAGLFYTFNKYRVAEMEQDEIPVETPGTKMFKGRLIHGANLGRLKRFKKIHRASRIYNENDIHAMMSDHAGGKGEIDTICRHDPTTSTTLCSAILDPLKREMKVIVGTACSGEYRKYSLDETCEAVDEIPQKKVRRA